MTWLWFAIFGICFLTTAYVYFGYPAILLVVSRLRPRPHHRSEIHPPLSIVVPVFNEEAVIRQKLDSLLRQSYPAEKMEVLVVSDGSTDRTQDIVLECDDQRVQFVGLPRQGKSAALNEGARLASGEILVLTDANAMLEPDALAKLVESLADPEVGGVCGRQRYSSPEDADSTAGGEGLYWRYDLWQKSLESRIGSIFAADGSLYCLRRELYVPIEDTAQADDIAISTRVVTQGYRLVLEERAVAVEEAPTESLREFGRKVRVTTHSVRAVLNLGRDLWTSGFYSFELLSHKLFRHFVPIFLLGMLVSSALLAGRSHLMLLMLVGQIAFFALGMVGFLLRRRSVGRWRLFTIPYFFTLVNAAALIGILRLVMGWRPATWSPRGGV